MKKTLISILLFGAIFAFASCGQGDVKNDPDSMTNEPSNEESKAEGDETTMAQEEILKDAGILKVMSYNVKTGDMFTEENSARAKKGIQNIKDFDPDVLGTQELNYGWKVAMRSDGLLNTYSVLGDPRGKKYDTQPGNEFSAILYKKDKFDLIESDTLWLSDTPTVIGSKIPESKYIRIMTYAVLERKADKQRFLFVNTHIDYAKAAYPKQSLILLDLTKQILERVGDMPYFFTGDFNFTPDSEGYANMIGDGVLDSRHIAEETTDAPTIQTGKVIDFCFVSDGDFEVKKFSVGAGFEGSDHYPVMVEMNFKK